MEEILASIRRIIADDDQQPVRRPVPRREDGQADLRRPDPRPEAGRMDPHRPAAPRPETGRGPVMDGRIPAPAADRVRHEVDRAFAPRIDAARTEALTSDGRPEAPRGEAPRTAPVRPQEGRRPDAFGETPPPQHRPEPIRAEPVRVEPVRAETVRIEPPHVEPVRYGTQRPEAQQTSPSDLARPSARPEPSAPEAGRVEPVRFESHRAHAPRHVAEHSEQVLADGQGPQLARPEALYAHGERSVSEVRFAPDERKFSRQEGDGLARAVESELLAAVSIEPQRPEAVPEVSRPVARPMPDIRPPRPSVMAEGRRKDLLSPAVDAAVMAAFESLGDVSIGQTALPEQGRTVEDLIKEILRPMLKTWLDDHLPDIVERLVRAEIERVARNGR